MNDSNKKVGVCPKHSPCVLLLASSKAAWKCAVFVNVPSLLRKMWWSASLAVMLEVANHLNLSELPNSFVGKLVLLQISRDFSVHKINKRKSKAIHGQNPWCSEIFLMNMRIRYLLIVVSIVSMTLWRIPPRKNNYSRHEKFMCSDLLDWLPGMIQVDVISMPTPYLSSIQLHACFKEQIFGN